MVLASRFSGLGFGLDGLRVFDEGSTNTDLQPFYALLTIVSVDCFKLAGKAAKCCFIWKLIEFKY